MQYHCRSGEHRDCLLSWYREWPDQKGLHTAQKSELKANIRTIETQMTSPKPKVVVVRESLHSIRNILEGDVGSGLAAETIYESLRLLRQ